jgi:hypothetical protein
MPGITSVLILLYCSILLLCVDMTLCSTSCCVQCLWIFVFSLLYITTCFSLIGHHQVYRLLWWRNLLHCCNVAQLFFSVNALDYSKLYELSRCCRACVQFNCNMYWVILRVLFYGTYLCIFSLCIYDVTYGFVGLLIFLWFSVWLSWM